jgi:hypothetical protein
VAARRQGRCRTKPRHACEPSRPSSQSTTRPRSCAPGRAVVDSTVNLAIHGLLTPALAPAAPVSGHDTPTAASQRADTDVDGQDLDDDEDPEAVHELHDRLIEIRRALDDLGAATTEGPMPLAGRTAPCRRTGQTSDVAT